jgi:hypothetical protein
MAEPIEDEEQKQDAAAPRSAKYWHERLEEYKRAVEDKWSDQRKNLDKLYCRDERADSSDREYSIFWANIEVLRPATYARPPVPVVAPRFKQTNPLASSASDLLERCLITTFEQGDIDGCMREVRDEFLRYSRGTARVRLDQGARGVERIAFDHFTASDFAHDPARTWREVKWVAFRAWLNSKDMEKRFGGGMAALGLDVKAVPKKKREGESEGDKTEDRTPVWEIWCRTSGKVHFVVEDFDSELDTQEPWLDLSNFWPCPRPAFGTTVPGKLKPVPDIRQYKDQIEEINEYTARIAALSESLRVKGFYPAGAPELSDAIETALKSSDNRATLVPVSSAAALGGSSFKEAIVWLPVRDIIEIIKYLVDLRRVVIDDVYQITGISDILRGQTDPNETLGAQQLKSQTGSARIRERQNELIRFARDLTRIAAEIIAENFQQQTMVEMAQVQLPSNAQKQQAQQKFQMQQAQTPQQPGQPGMPQAQPQQPPPELVKLMKTPSIEDVMGFLRDDKARGFVIEIETDSTIQPDEDAEKQRRVEFVTAIGGLIKEAGPMVAQAPQLGPFIGEVVKFVAQGFRAGRPLEGAIETLVQGLAAFAEKGMQPKGPDPTEQIKLKTAEVRGQAEQVGAQAKIQQTGMEMQRSKMEHEQDMQRLMAESMMPQQPQGPFQ